MLALLCTLALADTGDTGDSRPVTHDDEATATLVYVQGEGGCGGNEAPSDSDTGDTGAALLVGAPGLALMLRRRRAAG